MEPLNSRRLYSGAERLQKMIMNAESNSNKNNILIVLENNQAYDQSPGNEQTFQPFKLDQSLPLITAVC